MAPTKEVRKPANQLQLTEKEMEEEVTKQLTANNPNAPRNIARQGALHSSSILFSLTSSRLSPFTAGCRRLSQNPHSYPISHNSKLVSEFS